MKSLVVVYRINTYPLIHLGFLHAFLNVITLIPLLERFEAENGTLLSGAMFAGRIDHFKYFLDVQTKSQLIC